MRQPIPLHLRNTLYLSAVESFWGLGLSVVSMGTVLPVFLEREGASNRVIALLPSLGALGAGLFQALSGYLTRRSERIRPWVLWLHVAAPAPLALVALRLWLAPDTPAVAAVLAAWTTFYAFLGILFPLWLDYMARVLDPGRRGRAFGTIFLTQTLAGALGVALAAGLLKRDESRATYALLFLVAWAAMAGGSLFFAGTRGEVVPGRRSPVPSLAGHLRNLLALVSEHPWLKPYMVARWMVRGTFPLVVNFFAVIAVKEGGASPSMAALFGSAALASQALAGLAAGHLGDRHGHRLPVLLGQGCLVASATLLLLPLPPAAYFAVAALAGAFMSTEYMSQSSWVMDLAGPRDRQAALALSGLLLTPFAAVAPWVGGLFMDLVGFRPVALCVAGILVAAMGLELRWIPVRRQPAEPS